MACNNIKHRGSIYCHKYVAKVVEIAGLAAKKGKFVIPPSISDNRRKEKPSEKISLITRFILASSIEEQKTITKISYEADQIGRNTGPATGQYLKNIRGSTREINNGVKFEST